CPKRDATPRAINSAGRAQVESGLAHEDLPVTTKTPPQQVARIEPKARARAMAKSGMRRARSAVASRNRIDPPLSREPSGLQAARKTSQADETDISQKFQL